MTISAIALTVALGMIACEKNNNISFADLITAEDDAIADMAYDDVFSQVDGIMNLMDMYGYELTALKSGMNDTCPVISIVHQPGSFWPRTVIVDFGDGCDNGHRTHEGKIIIEVSGPMWLEGSYRLVTFEDFYVNGHKVEGTRTVTNEGRHEGGEYDGLWYFSVMLEGGKITTPDSTVITKDVNRIRTFVEGEDTKWDTRDDIWYIEGIATGTNRRGVAYTHEITSPLWKEIGCRFITRGTVLISVEGRPDVILDFGDGECDPFATVTVGDQSERINLRRW